MEQIEQWKQDARDGKLTTVEVGVFERTGDNGSSGTDVQFETPQGNGRSDGWSDGFGSFEDIFPGLGDLFGNN